MLGLSLREWAALQLLLPRWADAAVLLPDAGFLGLLRDLLSGLFLVRLDQCRGEIAFPVLAALNERDDVF